jgi:hypothetical protein
MANELIKALNKAIEKFKNFDDLVTRLSRYRDILDQKIQDMTGDATMEIDGQDVKEQKNDSKNKNGGN